MSMEEYLSRHLAKWGLREIFHEQDYNAWQRHSLSPQVLTRLTELSEKRQGGADVESDQDFYDLASSSTVLPVLYSQRFGYYQAIGTAIRTSLEPGKSILDFGCGVGILTTWYALMFPDCVFTGVDRSAQSIARARQQAKTLHLTNVSFYSCTVPEDNLSGIFDVIISTQALFQSETAPGLASRSWLNFERDLDPERQTRQETQTGIGERLDWLLARLSPRGRLLAFEKTSHLGRRVLFQRALAARGLSCDQKPVFLRYASLDEHILDGPLYSLTLQPTGLLFDETPLIEPSERLYQCQGRHADRVWSEFSAVGSLGPPVHIWWDDQEIHWQVCRTAAGFVCGRLFAPRVFTGVLVGRNEDEERLKHMVEGRLHRDHQEQSLQKTLCSIWPTSEPVASPFVPLYENHFSSAQDIWLRLSGRVIHRETTQTASDGQQYHVELGRCASQLAYLYWANTFDQRQIVVMEEKREHVLDEYFSESSGNSNR